MSMNAEATHHARGESRRTFLKHAVSGAAFTVPVIASVAMDGRGPSLAEAFHTAQNCSALPAGTSPTCQQLVCLLNEIVRIGPDAGLALENASASPAKRAFALEALGNAIRQFTRGIRSGGDTCLKSKGSYRGTRHAMEDLRDNLERAGVPSSAPVIQAIAAVLVDLNHIIQDL